MEQKMNIKEMKFWQENQDTLNYLVEKYFELPTTQTIKGCYIALTREQWHILGVMHAYILEYERDITINAENSFIFNRIEQLRRNSIIVDKE